LDVSCHASVDRLQLGSLGHPLGQCSGWFWAKAERRFSIGMMEADIQRDWFQSLS
jgi:hypothetical protein